jgi:hypothetical protein
MVFIHPVIMRDVLSGDHYTRQKYNKLKAIQDRSRITERGILKQKAMAFPTDLRGSLTQKLTAAQKKQIIIREQQQRVLAHQRKIQQAKLAQQKQNRLLQQRRAAELQAKYRPAVTTPAKRVPARLQNVMPPKRN